jgi:GntR family transcriptional regulator
MVAILQGRRNGTFYPKAGSMDLEPPIRQPSLSDQVYQILLNGINEGTYKPGSQLPTENFLADQLKVSRSTIRGAIARLEARGFIRRQRGIGTYVSELPGIASPLNQFIDIRRNIAGHGYEPGFKQLKTEIIPADQVLAQTLQLEVGASVLHIQKLFTADDAPILFFENFIPAWVFEDQFPGEEVIKPGFTEPFFDFFASQCSRPVAYISSSVRPAYARDCNLPAEFFVDDPLALFLVVDDLGYDQEENQVFFSKEFLTREASRLEFLRYVEMA